MKPPETRLFGLIGKTLGHSFSKSYFTEKFKKLGLTDHLYELFELPEIEKIKDLIRQNPTLAGLNVTIPYKTSVMDFLTEVDPLARRIGAVNTIKITAADHLLGFNTDYYGFYQSLKSWLAGNTPPQALILGTGGAAAAVKVALQDLEIAITSVGRSSSHSIISYQQLKALHLGAFPLIVNTTPLGMAPHTNTAPDLNYDQLGPQHSLYDLVYNPPRTTFMERGEIRGARVKNGMEMLQLQAEKAWEIWNT